MTILIVLVAVIVLIVVIAILALHFLRADDSDIFDEIPDESRRSKRQAPEPMPEPAVAATADRGRARRADAVTEAWSAPTASADRAATSRRDRESGPRPVVTPERRTGPRPVAAGTRPPRPSRPADQDARTSSWDSMSDVDYWAELAADKPQITPAAAAAATPARSSRRGPDPKQDSRKPAEARPAGRTEQPALPVRQRGQAAAPSSRAPRPAAATARAADPGQTEQLDIRAARSGAGYPEPAAQGRGTQGLAALGRQQGQPSGQRPAQQRPGSGQRNPNGPRHPNGQRPGLAPVAAQRPLPASGPAGAPPPSPTGASRLPMPLDDDPLTSPSFPAISTSDSRSYRTRRPGSARPADATPVDNRSARRPADDRSRSGYSEPAARFPQYPAGSDRSASLPGGYPTPAAAMPPARPAPVANPYGSYVATPAPGYQDAAPSPLDAQAAYGSYAATPRSAGQQPGGWYGGDAMGGHGSASLGRAADGYLAAPLPNGTPAHYGNGSPGDYPATDHPAAAGYPAAGYQGQAYQGQPAAYGQPGHPAAQHYDPRGYGGPELTYGQDGYQGYGYGTGR